MPDALLTLNAGSSSVKFALFACTDGRVPPQPELVGQIDGIGATPHLKAKNAAGTLLADNDLQLAASDKTQHQSALDFLVGWLARHASDWKLIAVGHRVVHGGQHFSAPQVLDAGTMDALRGLIPLAPLHQPHNLAGIAAISAARPGLPQIACFDTAFHRTQPELAQRFALPRQYTDEGVRRYGFHGLSYEYIATVLAEHLPPAQAEGRVIVAHLGNGASMCALQHGQSRATTMGFTAIDGLMMGTRSGNIDPGVLLYLMENHGMDVKALTRLLYQESGLLGVSGVSQDMRTLLESAHADARLAVDLFCYRAVREIGSLAAAIGGLDALVFTGGIGEHAPAIREKICAELAWLGLYLDPAANDANARRISTPTSRISASVIPTNEEWIIAGHTAKLLG